MAITSDNIEVVQLLMSNTVMLKPTYLPLIGQSIPASSSVSNPYTVLSTQLAGSYGARLASVSIAVDSVFQTNFYWRVIVDGVVDPNIPFQPFDPTVNVFDLVPSGTFFLLKPGAGIHIQAYNNNSGNTTNGIMSIYIALDLLDQTMAKVYKLI